MTEAFGRSMMLTFFNKSDDGFSQPMKRGSPLFTQAIDYILWNASSIDLK